MHDTGVAGAGGDLSWFRQEFHRCLPRRADALFELCDAVLCADGPVRSVAELSLIGEHRRGHGSGYAALARGAINIQRLLTAVLTAAMPSIDADFVIGYMVAMGAFGDSAEGLRRLKPVHRATLSVSMEDL